MMNKLYYKSLEYLLYLLPISIIISNFFTNFIVYYLSIFGIFQLILKKKYDLINNKYCYIFVIFCIYITLRSLFLENNILFSLKSSVTLIRYLFFYVAIVTIIKNNNFIIKNFVIILSLILIFLLIDSSVQFFTGQNLLGLTEQTNNRISSLFNGRYVLGSYVSKIIFLYLYLLNFQYPFRNYKFSYFIIIIASLFLILISGDRAALGIYFLTSIIFIILLDKNFLKIKNKLSIIFLIIIFIITTISFSNTLKGRFVNQTLNDFKTAENIFYFSKGHESHWKTSFKMFINNKLFGIGPNMFRKKCDLPLYNSGKKSCTTHPHNYYFQLLGETGLVGFLLLFLTYLSISLKLLKQILIVNFKNKVYLNTNNLFISILFFCNFWPIITTGNFFSSFTANLIVLPICFINIKSENVK